MKLRQQHQDLVETAQRIVLRQQQGQTTIAAELIVRALATSDADTTFALALALTEQALQAVEESRLNATSGQHAWQPAMADATGALITAQN